MSLFYTMDKSDAAIDAMWAPLSREAEDRVILLESDLEFLSGIKRETQALAALVEKRNQEQPSEAMADALLEATRNAETFDDAMTSLRRDIDCIWEWDKERKSHLIMDYAEWRGEQRRFEKDAVR